MALRPTTVPNRAHTVQFAEPDGTRFKAVVLGDERRRWVETEKHYTIVRELRSGRWEYARLNDRGELVPSGILVQPAQLPPPTIQPYLVPPLPLQGITKTRPPPSSGVPGYDNWTRAREVSVLINASLHLV